MSKRAICIGNKDGFDLLIKKVICIRNIKKDHPVFGLPLNIGEVYIAHYNLGEKYDGLVSVYKEKKYMGVYPKYIFKFIEDFRHERVDKLIK